jgi:hypothetical protein
MATAGGVRHTSRPDGGAAARWGPVRTGAVVAGAVVTGAVVTRAVVNVAAMSAGQAEQRGQLRHVGDHGVGTGGFERGPVVRAAQHAHDEACSRGTA